MYENELKFKINDLANFEQSAMAMGIEFGNTKHQIDTVYIQKDSDGTNLISG